MRYVDAVLCRDADWTGDGDTTDANDWHLYYTQDANFNTTALVNSSGTVVERYVYDPYGQVTIWNEARTSTLAWADSKKNEILFCGYRYDPETGLYHVRHRMYHSTLGRWLQRDPLGYVDGMGLYEYVQSAPAGTTDPSGRILKRNLRGDRADGLGPIDIASTVEELKRILSEDPIGQLTLQLLNLNDVFFFEDLSLMRQALSFGVPVGDPQDWDILGVCTVVHGGIYIRARAGDNPYDIAGRCVHEATHRQQGPPKSGESRQKREHEAWIRQERWRQSRGLKATHESFLDEKGALSEDNIRAYVDESYRLAPGQGWKDTSRIIQGRTGPVTGWWPPTTSKPKPPAESGRAEQSDDAPRGATPLKGSDEGRDLLYRYGPDGRPPPLENHNLPYEYGKTKSTVELL